MLVNKISKFKAMTRGLNSILFRSYGAIFLPNAPKNGCYFAMISNSSATNALLCKLKSRNFSSLIAQVDGYLHTFEFEKAEKKLKHIIDGIEAKEGVNELDASDIYLRYGKVLLTRYGVLKYKEALDYFKKALQLNPGAIKAKKSIGVIEEHTMASCSLRRKLR